MDLLDGFVGACRSAGAHAPVVDLEGAGMDLLRRWGDEARGYHDVEHLTEVLDRLHELQPHVAPETVLAAWFHDAVYDGVPGQDEQRSADLAAGDLAALGAPEPVCARVAALVLVTADHRPPSGDADAEALCDADLAVLAADADRYERYVAGVRSEYGHLDDDTFRSGRAAVLRALLGREQLYRTPVGRSRWEQPARRNITGELERLGACG